ncbi:hypothetical protein KMP11_00525 [Gemella sp. zg-570]|uniref:hypothetical protein n=1 Tax=Gemella sp. zg-570 TaxID=2840371 RepID=UPI001C0D513A|nr:hypothetical protein [Gemella sp. zg-570]QWQ38887.1 hypothetical protein KMP11_00525 [Gemella sp. zg-570]
MLRIKKERIKTFILLILISSSLFLTYIIVGYKTNYEILGGIIEGKQENQNITKIQQNSLNLLSPYIIIKNNVNAMEEQALPNTITKVSNVEAIKNKNNISQIIKELSDLDVEVSRISNNSINDIITQSKNYFIMKYKNDIDTLSSQVLYSDVDKQAINLDIDTILLSDSKDNILYFYKNGTENYMQVVFKENIYKRIDDLFVKNSKTYNKYVIAGSRDFYVKKVADYTIDEYNTYKVDIKDVFNDIFSAKGNVKISTLASETKEITDGYSILRQNADSMIYINPSNMINNARILKSSEIQSEATSFLISSYLPNSYYSTLGIDGDTISYQEVYKEGFAFSDDLTSDIKVKVTKEGVAQLTIPRVHKEALVSSSKLPLYHLENIAVVLNYIYAKLDIEKFMDMELAYKKTYKKDRIIYSPAWYINYDGKYYKFSDLKEKRVKGEL